MQKSRVFLCALLENLTKAAVEWGCPDCHHENHVAPGKNTKEMAHLWGIITLLKKHKSGTRGHNILSTGQEENDFPHTAFQLSKE